MNKLMIFEGHEVEVLEVEGQALFNSLQCRNVLRYGSRNS